MVEREVEAELLAQRRARVGAYALGARTSAMIYVGMELGLYAALRDGGAATPVELAARTELHERWLREWLFQQASSGILEYDLATKRFAISPEVWVLIGDPDELRSLRVNFGGLPHRFATLDRLPESFRTGLGVGMDGRGPAAAEVIEQVFRNWYRQVLVPVALPKIEGVVAKLRGGCEAADVGCGSGLAMIEMARAFPASRFHGYDTSLQMIERGRANVLAAGVANVTFHDALNDPLPHASTYSLITTLDCLHDMTRPHDVAAAIRGAIKTDGVWFIADIDGAEDFEHNLTERPLAALLYANSVMSCMSSALSEPGGAGYGTLGLPEPVMRKLVEDAGFSHFRRVDLEHPVNAYYEARP